MYDYEELSETITFIEFLQQLLHGLIFVLETATFILLLQFVYKHSTNSYIDVFLFFILY